MARYSPGGWMLRLAVKHGRGFALKYRGPVSREELFEELRIEASRGFEWTARTEPLAAPSRPDDVAWTIRSVEPMSMAYFFEAPSKDALRRLRLVEVQARACAAAAKAPSASASPSAAKRI